MTRASKSTASASLSEVPSVRVLIVEDSRPMAMLLSELLGFMGHDVAGAATTEEEAVALALHCSPDLLLMDVQLREGSGLAALARILPARPVPHIIMSGSQLDARLFGRNSAVLRKPFSEAELRQAMHLALDGREGHAAAGG